jgi:hypothetical protein
MDCACRQVAEQAVERFRVRRVRVNSPTHPRTERHNDPSSGTAVAKAVTEPVVIRRKGLQFKPSSPPNWANCPGVRGIVPPAFVRGPVTLNIR